MSCTSRMLFYLGTHRPNWLGKVDVPLFVSHRTLKDRRSLPRASAPWALDSGAFSELSQFGEWRTTASEYVEAVARYQEIGLMEWAAPMDWMCEPFMVEKTGLSIEEHQKRTVENFLELRDQGPFVPVLQGWTLGDYQEHVLMYEDYGVDLTEEDRVGLGTVCRREATNEIGHLVRSLAAEGIRLHGFGIKLSGLRKYGQFLTSADSMAWSYAGRKQGPLRDCTHKGKCANCLDFALMWRSRVQVQGALEVAA